MREVAAEARHRPDGREVEVRAGATVTVDGPCEIELGAHAVELTQG